MRGAPKHDWYFRQWAITLGVRFPHAWLQKELGYSDGKASNVLNGRKRYDRDIINEVAAALNILPHELLMDPEDAMRLRRIRDEALRIAADSATAPPVAPVRLPAPTKHGRKTG